MAAHRMQRPRLTRRIVLLIAAVLGIQLAVAGTAMAYYSSHGTGTGSATTGTLTISVPSASIVQALYPGGTADVALTVTNPGSSTLQITSITAGAVMGCTAPGVSLNLAGPYPSLAPGTNHLTLSGAAQMSTASSADCQGATLNVPLTVAVQQ